MNHLKKGQQSKLFERKFNYGFLQFDRGFEFQGSVSETKYFDQKLYLNEFKKRKITILDTLGNVLYRLPKTLEKEAIFKIYDFDIDERGVYIVDFDRKMFALVGHRNTFEYSYSISKTIGRAGRLKEDLFIINTFDRTRADTTDRFNIAFMLVDPKNKVNRMVNYPLPKVRHSSMKLSGFYTRNNNQKTFYICYKAGLFFCINQNGEFLYQEETIDKTPLPKIIESAVGMNIKYDPHSPFVNRSAGADDKYLYILSHLHSPNEKRADYRAVDVYRVGDGSYAFSIKIHDYKGEKAYILTVTPKGLYIRYGESYFVYYKFTSQSNLFSLK